jgi:hypothetical protein
MKTTRVFGFYFDSTINGATATPRANGDPVTGFDSVSAYVNVPFRVRSMKVTGICAYFLTGSVIFTQPDTIFQVHSDIGGSEQIIGFAEHDTDISVGISEEYDIASLREIRGIYNFKLRDLSGNIPVVNANPLLPTQHRGYVNVMIQFST